MCAQTGNEKGWKQQNHNNTESSGNAKGTSKPSSHAELRCEKGKKTGG